MHKIETFTRQHHWKGSQGVDSRSFRCGYCSSDVASGTGWITEANNPSELGAILICPHCNGPTFFDVESGQWPGPREGASVTELPDDVEAIYQESRASIASKAFTGSVMLCRKILMHVAVEKEAKTGLSFRSYVKYLVDQHYVPRGADGWLDYIRSRGNFANHEIVVMTKADASGVLAFTEALLRNVYELPALVPGFKPPERNGEPDQETPEPELE